MQYEFPLNIIIAGVGGQGNILSSRLIASTAVLQGYHATVGETYGAAQRGGPVMSHVRISEKEKLGPLIPYGKGHILLGFEPVETLRVGSRYLNPDSSVIMNTRPIYPVDVLVGLTKYPDVSEAVEKTRKLCKRLWTLDAVELARNAGNVLTMNIVMVGSLAGSKLTPIEPASYRKTIEKEIRRWKETNLKAFDLGVEAVTSQ